MNEIPLPSELLSHTAKLLAGGKPIANLNTLSCTCKSLKEICRPIMFRSVRLYLDPHLHVHEDGPVHSVLALLRPKKSTIAQHIRVLELCGYNVFPDGSAEIQTLSEPTLALVLAHGLLPNLAHLYLNQIAFAEETLPMSLQPKLITHLRSMSIHGLYRDREHSPSPLSIITLLPSLESLTISFEPDSASYLACETEVSLREMSLRMLSLLNVSTGHEGLCRSLIQCNEESLQTVTLGLAAERGEPNAKSPIPPVPRLSTCTRLSHAEFILSLDDCHTPLSFSRLTRRVKLWLAQLPATVSSLEVTFLSESDDVDNLTSIVARTPIVNWSQPLAAASLPLGDLRFTLASTRMGIRDDPWKSIKSLNPNWTTLPQLLPHTTVSFATNELPRAYVNGLDDFSTTEIPDSESEDDT